MPPEQDRRATTGSHRPALIGTAFEPGKKNPPRLRGERMRRCRKGIRVPDLASQLPGVASPRPFGPDIGHFAEHAFARQPGIAQQAIVPPVQQHFQRGIDRRPRLLLPRLCIASSRLARPNPCIGIAMTSHSIGFSSPQ